MSPTWEGHQHARTDQRPTHPWLPDWSGCLIGLLRRTENERIVRVDSTLVSLVGLSYVRAVCFTVRAYTTCARGSSKMGMQYVFLRVGV